ncbi:hypothetical protein AAMO2058_000014000 [Amorphochlora amoebiformis]
MFQGVSFALPNPNPQLPPKTDEIRISKRSAPRRRFSLCFSMVADAAPRSPSASHEQEWDEGRDGKFGETFREHVARSSANSAWYVNYGLLMDAGRQKCRNKDFRALYLREAMKFVRYVRDGQEMDGMFLEINLEALEKACHFFDQNQSSESRSTEEGEHIHLGIDPACPPRFQERLQNQLESMGYQVELRILTVEERCERLFQELKGTDDFLDEKALRRGLRKLGLPSSPSAVRRLLLAADKDRDGKVSKGDFQEFVFERERQIYDIFQELNTSKTSFLEPKDILRALKKLGMRASEAEVLELIQRTHRRLGQNEDIKGVDHATFRQLLTLLPSEDPQDVIDYWLQAVDFDFTSTDETPAQEQKSFLETFIAGGIAGAVSRTCTAPLDRLKLLLQTDANGKYRGILQGLYTIYEDGKKHRLALDRGQKTKATGWRGVLGGLLSFFRGNGTNVVKIAPETALRFWAYENAKTVICRKPSKPSLPERFLCGALGGICAQTCIYPLEIVKTRLAIAPPETYKGITHCLFKISRKEGFGALYKGLTASVMGIIPYSGVDMAVYFSLREKFPDVGPMGMLACGAVSSTCGVVCSFPLQLARTRLQATGLDGMPKYRGVADVLRRTVSEDGMIGLYRGFAPTMLKALPAISITYAVYEVVKKNLIQFREFS